MSIRHRSVELSVVCGLEELTPYGVQVDSDSAISASIVSEVGKAFRVQCYSRSDHTLRVKSYVDGHLVNKSLLKAGETFLIKGCSTSSSDFLPFVFSEVELIDPDTVNELYGADHSKIGLIEVVCHRIRVLDFYEWFENVDGTPLLGGGRISEKSKKAGWHHVALGSSAQREKEITKAQVVLMDREDTPYVTFRIRYQSRELLMAQGIIPREVHNDVEEVTAASFHATVSNTAASHKRRCDTPASENSNSKRKAKSPKHEISAQRQMSPGRVPDRQRFKSESAMVSVDGLDIKHPPSSSKQEFRPLSLFCTPIKPVHVKHECLVKPDPLSVPQYVQQPVKTEEAKPRIKYDVTVEEKNSSMKTGLDGLFPIPKKRVNRNTHFPKSERSIPPTGKNFSHVEIIDLTGD
ncbi:hypothetical protein BV25DRAFT_843302 [Artomyces pyxidatus]|uniref:Uncharacterized protein n=1 Tax=Artomyces pyxidatus TaxID=48021 RepID=A0ACB8TGX6_9AGAM|nr:hypothetical protein BV25DRAFT_843302 [Artomyces pyxidatus]